MRRFLAFAVLAAACADSPAPAPSATCEVNDCRLPGNLVLAAELIPPTDSLLVQTDISPEQIRLSRGVLTLDFGAAKEVSIDVRAEGVEDEVFPADVVLSRPSLISGRSAILTQASTAPGQAATVRVLADATYTASATPQPPEDERYLRNVTREIEPEDTLSLLLHRPAEAIEGRLLDEWSSDVNVRLQAFRPGSDDRTTVARLGPGDGFALGALEIEGEWTVQAKVTFPDPNPDPGAPGGAPVEGLEFVLEAGVICEADAGGCVLAEGTLPDLDIPLPPLPEPRKSTLVVRGIDAAGVPTIVPSAAIIFESDIALPGTHLATLTARVDSDAEGSASVHLVDGFEYRVTITPPSGSEFATRSFERVSGGPMDFSLDRRVKLSGRVYAAQPQEDGAGVPGVTVTAVPSPNQESSVTSSRGGMSFTTTTDERGDFLLRVDLGVYDLQVTPPVGSPHPIWSSDNVPVDSDVTGLQVVLPRGVTVPVLVRSGGNPVAGAMVRMLAVSEEEGRGPRLRGWAVTDEQGEALLVLPDP